jgi:hypothetical protein
MNEDFSEGNKCYIKEWNRKLELKKHEKVNDSFVGLKTNQKRENLRIGKLSQLESEWKENEKNSLRNSRTVWHYETI